MKEKWGHIAEIMASDAEGMSSEQISIRFLFYIDTHVACSQQSFIFFSAIFIVIVVNQVKCREFDGGFLCGKHGWCSDSCFHLLRKIICITAYYICATSVSLFLS